MKVFADIIHGKFVSLEPFSEEHFDGLRLAGNHPIIWKYMFHRAMDKGFDEWVAYVESNRNSGNMIPYAVRQKSDKRIIGFSSYLNISEKDDRIEIGYTWFTPEVWGFQKNPQNAETLFLQIKNAFFTFGANRIEFRVDSRNRRSQFATEAVGVVKEGVLRKHMKVQNGYVRDTIVYSLLRDEWPGVDERFKNYFQQFSQ
jgi:RimJ/RimL family protein N-acetyltransferase